jgi:hypothetical protein
MNHNTKLFCLFLKAQKQDKLSEQGYAMAVVSILSIIMFSLLAASLIFSGLAKSRTDAFVDSQSSFSVAESGLNKRAVEFRAKLETYSGVEGVTDATGEKGLATCFGIQIPTGVAGKSARTGTNDFECQNYRFKSSNNIAKAVSGGNISLNSGGQEENTYIAYTLVSDRTKYIDGSPQYMSIPTSEPFAGLNAAEYKYVIYSIGKKPVTLPTGSTLPTYTEDEKAAINRQEQGKPAESGDASLIASFNTAKNTAQTAGAAAEGKSSNNTNLSITFTNRVVPLFQFSIFYNGDLELNSTASMQIKGWVHSNANIYVQPAGVSGAAVRPVTTLLSNMSAYGSIYNRLDAWQPGIGRTGITRVLLTGDSCATTTATPANCQDIPGYVAATITPLTAAQITAFPDKKVQDGANGATLLKTPSPGFTRKRNYATDKIGIYYSQADMRLEMVPDRDVTSKVPATWTRNKAIIPFNFTAIRTGGTGTCTTASPALNTDPAENYVDPTREKFSTRKCNVFTKGQLQSLRQPVMVLTNINQTNTALRATEDTTLGKPNLAPLLASVPTVLLPTAPTPLTDGVKAKILRALQVALVSTASPVPFDKLDKPFTDSAYVTTGSLADFTTGFNYLLTQIPTSELTVANRNILSTISPIQIAALGGAWFLPAPIQRIERPAVDTGAIDTDRNPSNPRQSGFYDGREKRWITMLQTNIASLSVWNRDGVYVDALDTTLTSAYSTDNSARGTAFNAGTGANFTSGFAFDRSAADATKPVGSLQYLGLGSSDKTEGGLVFHATVRDDLDGNGTISTTNDITVDKTDTTQRILRKNRDNTDFSPVEILDYYRKYPGLAQRQSPFAFAFNGGDYLPNALLLSSDQSIYVQGNFNNSGATQPNTTGNTPSPDRLPASIVADTITALSNECVRTPLSPTTDLSGDPLSIGLGQLKCGLPPTINGGRISYDSVSSPMAINAAFLSNTQVSVGNLGTNRGYNSSVAGTYSGGVNNYIRLLEDWDNNGVPYPLNYSGSLVSLGAPLEYSGNYKPGGGNPDDLPYYDVPFRNFNYDPFFSKVEKLPPLTPKASYIQQKDFSRAY